MADTVDQKTRSRIMARIHGKDTTIEILVRKALFSKGYRYRINDKKLPGCPDVVLKKYRAVLFVHGCFWHVHTCHIFRAPASNEKYWSEKLDRNKSRDIETTKKLMDMGWRVLIVWECALKGKNKKDFGKLIDEIETWLHGDSVRSEISGNTSATNQDKTNIPKA